MRLLAVIPPFREVDRASRDGPKDSLREDVEAGFVMHPLKSFLAPISLFLYTFITSYVRVHCNFRYNQERKV